MKKCLFYSLVILSFSITSCNNLNESKLENIQLDSTVAETTNDMKTFISIFEIPAIQISRAVRFYQSILNIKIEVMEFPEMKMGVFPYEGQMVTGVIIQGEGYKPSAEGVTLYLNGGENLQLILDKIEMNGGKIIMQKTAHADESGYFALFLDTEGNKIGLSSPN